MEHPKHLYRSDTDRVIGGVCGGMGDFFSVDSNLVRIVFVFLTLVGAGILLYLICWLLIPLRGSKISPEKEIHDTLHKVEEEVRVKHWLKDGDFSLGFWLIVVGIVLLLVNFNFLDFSFVSRLWPFILILIGWHFYSRSKS